MKQLIKIARRGPFTLHLFDTGTYDYRGQTRMAYRLFDSNPSWKGTPVFDGSDFCGSPLHADDSRETVDSLLCFLSLQVGDTDTEYFENYSDRQTTWRDSRAGLLASYLP